MSPRPVIAAVDAEQYRLLQADELLRELGYVEHPDGIWVRPAQR